MYSHPNQDNTTPQFQPINRKSQVSQIGRFQYRTCDVLGKGSFGIVYKGFDPETKMDVAIKVQDKKQIDQDNFLFQSLQQEIYFMMKLKSDNIVKLVDYQETDWKYYIILEYCDSGNLSDIIKVKKYLAEDEAIQILFDILKGFRELLDNDIIHRDLKPENIMVHQGICKITDFGFSQYVENYEINKMSISVGTPLYMSPQTLQQQSYTTKCDIWSLGIIYYEMLTGSVAFPAKSSQELIRNLKTKKVTFPPKLSISENSKDFIRKFTYNESDRISWKQLYVHPVFNSFFDKIEIKESEKEQIPKQTTAKKQQNPVIIQHQKPKIQQIPKVPENDLILEIKYQDFLQKLWNEMENNFLELENTFSLWGIEKQMNLDYQGFQFMSELIYQGLQEDEISYIFQKFDLDKNQHIQLFEFSHCILQINNKIHFNDTFLQTTADRILQGLRSITKQMECTPQQFYEFTGDLKSDSNFELQHLVDLLNQIYVKLTKEELVKLYSKLGQQQYFVDQKVIKFKEFNNWIVQHSISLYLISLGVQQEMQYENKPQAQKQQQQATQHYQSQNRQPIFYNNQQQQIKDYQQQYNPAQFNYQQQKSNQNNLIQKPKNYLNNPLQKQHQYKK